MFTKLLHIVIDKIVIKLHSEHYTYIDLVCKYCVTTSEPGSPK